MTKMDLAPIYQHPKTSEPNPGHKIHPYLLRHLTIEAPNQVWCADVTYIERLWRSLKYECVFLNAFETGSEARAGIGRWIGYYDADRPHSTFDGRTPDEVYAMQEKDEKLAT